MKRPSLLEIRIILAVLLTAATLALRALGD